MRERKLPNDETTIYVDEYLKAWEAVGKPIARASGFMHMGSDPQIVLGSGVTGTAATVHLPVSFAVPLSEYIVKLEEDAAKWREHIRRMDE